MFTLLQQNGVVNPLFKTKPFVNSCQQGANRDFECHCNQESINKECAAFSTVSVFGFHTDTENGSFSKRTVFKFYVFSLAFSKRPVFTAEQCESKAKTEKFYSVFIWKRSSVNGALGLKILFVKINAFRDYKDRQLFPSFVLFW